MYTFVHVLVFCYCRFSQARYCCLPDLSSSVCKGSASFASHIVRNISNYLAWILQPPEFNPISFDVTVMGILRQIIVHAALTLNDLRCSLVKVWYFPNYFGCPHYHPSVPNIQSFDFKLILFLNFTSFRFLRLNRSRLNFWFARLLTNGISVTL